MLKYRFLHSLGAKGDNVTVISRTMLTVRDSSEFFYGDEGIIPLARNTVS